MPRRDLQDFIERKSPMWAVVRRAIVPSALAIAGLVLLVEGILHHPIHVLVEQKTTKTIDIPLSAPPDPSMNGSDSPGRRPSFPRGMGFARPAVIKQTVTLTELVALVISEPDATRDVTVGGLVRLDSGEHAGKLQRTYSGDKGPALCPT